MKSGRVLVSLRLASSVRDGVNYTTPSNAALFFIPLPLAAAHAMPKQLKRNPVNLKNATRDIDRSSSGVRDEAKMPRSTAGVTGIRLFPGFGLRLRPVVLDTVGAEEEALEVVLMVETKDRKSVV